MIATILLSLVIFGYAGKVLYRMVKKGSSSDWMNITFTVKSVAIKGDIDGNTTL